MEVSQFLRGERQAHGLSLSRLAAATGIAKSRLSDIERGVHSPTWATVERICAALGREAVLDTRVPIQVRAAERLATLGPRGRVEEGMHGLGKVWSVFARGEVRVALDRECAATLLGTPPAVASGWLQCGVPVDDLELLIELLEGVDGWSELFRDFRIVSPEHALAQREVSRWWLGRAPVEIRLVSSWRPVTVVLGEAAEPHLSTFLHAGVDCLPADSPSADIGAHPLLGPLVVAAAHASAVPVAHDPWFD